MWSAPEAISPGDSLPGANPYKVSLAARSKSSRIAPPLSPSGSSHPHSLRLLAFHQLSPALHSGFHLFLLVSLTLPEITFYLVHMFTCLPSLLQHTL